MKTFIEHIAEDILKRFGNNLSDITVVFPNRRASLFMDEALLKYSTKPVLAPKYLSITDLFSQFAGQNAGDRIKQVCLLHKVYCQCVNEEESLDRFYPWGEVLLSDFDDIDKHLLSAEKIFTNVKDLHELDDISYLTDEQKLALRNFFPDFDGNNTRLKMQFQKMWSHLSKIYKVFTQLLIDEGCLYEGLLQKQVVEKMKDNAFDVEDATMLFVGFNHLLPVEKELFTLLKRETDCLFYWDFDNYYLKTETGKDILENRLSFPNALDDENEEIYDNFSKEKDIQYISATTNIMQTRYVYDWLKENDRYKDGKDTVIVLADESLLPAVLHSIYCPQNESKIPVNITIGYNLSYTNIPTLLDSLMKESEYRNNDEITGKLNFLINSIQEKVKHTSLEDKALETESLFRTYTLLNRLLKLAEEGILNITENTLRKLISQLISSTSVPFHGEPLEGIQIMGVLETRNLDFKHILLLSCNEGVMPKSSNVTSFLPYFIRKAYGLTISDTRVDIFAYYFYRLIQRCNDVSILWNNSTEGTNRGEMSRFMLQLLVESPHNIVKKTLRGQHHIDKTLIRNIPKTDETMQKLAVRFNNTDSLISPSALNCYLRCPKRFYYQYVAELSEYQDDTEVEGDNRAFGNVFHSSVKKLYSKFINRQVTRTALDDINDTLKIKTIVETEYQKELNGIQLNGLQKIKVDVIVNYIQTLIKSDMSLCPFDLIMLEQRIESKKFPIAGYVDRIDKVRNEDGTYMYRIVDYKTGASMLKAEIENVSDVFNPQKIHCHSDYYLQAMLYALIFSSGQSEKGQHEKVAPCLLFIQHPKDINDPVLKFKSGERLDDIERYREEFEENLKALLSDIYNKNLDFICQEDNCNWCPYSILCKGV